MLITNRNEIQIKQERSRTLHDCLQDSSIHLLNNEITINHFISLKQQWKGKNQPITEYVTNVGAREVEMVHTRSSIGLTRHHHKNGNYKIAQRVYTCNNVHNNKWCFCLSGNALRICCWVFFISAMLIVYALVILP